jgi:hypothetical protein
MANIPLSLRSCCQNYDTIYHFFSSPSTTYNFSFAFPPLLQLLPNIHSCDFLISSFCFHFLIMSLIFPSFDFTFPLILSLTPLYPLDISSFPPFDFTSFDYTVPLILSLLPLYSFSSPGKFLYFLLLILLFLSLSLFPQFILFRPLSMSLTPPFDFAFPLTLFPPLYSSSCPSSFPSFDFTFPLILCLPPFYSSLSSRHFFISSF